MNNNTETIERAAEQYGFDKNGIQSEPYQAFISGASWQKEQDEAEIKRLNASYEDSLSMQRCSNAGYESKIREWESKYKALLDSHNELLDALIKTCPNIYAYKELINKAKNI